MRVFVGLLFISMIACGGRKIEVGFDDDMPSDLGSDSRHQPGGDGLPGDLSPDTGLPGDSKHDSEGNQDARHGDLPPDQGDTYTHDMEPDDIDAGPKDLESDGTDGGPDDVDAQLPPDCPVAVIECDEPAEVSDQTTLHLSGLSSWSPKGEIVKYQWSVETAPEAAQGVFVPSSGFPNPTYQLSVAGLYVFKLEVWDSSGAKSCEPAFYEVVGFPCDAVLYVELTWTTPGDNTYDTGPNAGADLDLHVAPFGVTGTDCNSDGVFEPWFSDQDCFWFQPSPEWVSGGAGGQANGLVLDDTDGWGPELFEAAFDFVGAAPDHNLLVGVHYWDDHGYGSSFAKVRIYVYGALAFEVEDVELKDGDFWEVALWKWPSGQVTLISDDTTNGYKIFPKCELPSGF